MTDTNVIDACDLGELFIEGAVDIATGTPPGTRKVIKLLFGIPGGTDSGITASDIRVPIWYNNSSHSISSKSNFGTHSKQAAPEAIGEIKSILDNAAGGTPILVSGKYYIGMNRLTASRNILGAMILYAILRENKRRNQVNNAIRVINSINKPNREKIKIETMASYSSWFLKKFKTESVSDHMAIFTMGTFDYDENEFVNKI